ncbi:MAG: hypothetical protein OTJ97_02260, partial [SAR202 cluster bacterium]|nr:hypothetical protein [SAR202 cluster bacterium]
DQGLLGVGRSYFSRLYQRVESGAREGLEAAARSLAEVGIVPSRKLWCRAGLPRNLFVLLMPTSAQ